MSQDAERVPQPTAVDIFFSYSRADKARMEPVVRLLELQGWSVWWDPDLIPGESFREVIERFLSSARCVVVAWSRHSVASDWVVGEASDARERRVLIPLRLDDTRLPIEFRGIQTADFSRWSGDQEAPEARELLAGIARHLGEPQGVDAPAGDPAGPVGRLERRRRRTLLVVIALVALITVAVRAWLDEQEREAKRLAPPASVPAPLKGQDGPNPR